MKFETKPHQLAALIASSALALSAISMAGCENDGPAEEAGEAIDEAAEDAGDAIDDTADDVEDAVDDATDG